MKKNKTGIITFHRAHNCGSLLQSYAIQNVLRKLNQENEIIDFSSTGQKNMYSIFPKNNSLRAIIKNFVYLFHYSTIKRHNSNYTKFIADNLEISKEKYKNVEELEKSNIEYINYIAGSDQIWNITIPDASDAYFLSFTQSKNKIAYAPSFGAKNIIEVSNCQSKYSKYLSEFKHLSIRENNGRNWIKDMIGKDVPVVLDPTLLLNQEDYNKISRPSGIKGDYIFYYSPRYKANIDKFVKKISKKYNLPVIVFNSKEYYFRLLNFKGFKMPYEQDPGIYLNLIKNAKMIITTSFHGTIFSTIYRKKFWVMKNGDMYSTDDRVITLLKELAIEDRLIEPNFENNFNYFKEVNYNIYDKKLEIERKKSMQFLNRCFNDKK